MSKPRKIIHLSDVHLVRPGETLLGTDPLQRFKAALSDISCHHADADALIITGDLSETGTEDSYQSLHSALLDTTIPTVLLMGNHDDRTNFTKVFPHFIDQNGFVQNIVALDNLQLICLDTLQNGHVNGTLCQRRLDWLQSQLKDARDQDVMIFMHHPPGKVYLPALDTIGLNDPDHFFDIVKSHPRVRRIFAGHFHRLVQGDWGGFPFTILRSSNHQTALDFHSTETSNSSEAPVYSITLLDEDNIITHFHEYPLHDS